jgi:hypothetical protein
MRVSFVTLYSTSLAGNAAAPDLGRAKLGTWAAAHAEYGIDCNIWKSREKRRKRI